MRVAAVIVAGGRSSRMGRDKAFEEINGQSILTRILARLKPQADLIVINARDGQDQYSKTGYRLVPDILQISTSPFAGLHAALQFARHENFDSVLTVPCDTPFLPDDLVARLSGGESDAVIAASAGQMHYLTGLWASSLHAKLENFLFEGQLFRLQDWAAYCKAVAVDWPVEPYDPFFNVNTPNDLAEARRIAMELLI
jgi:molybdopterin-guanine dinucleotide biosynthesis protein A